MPYRICKTIDIENGHMLSKHPDKCQFPHGHTRKVEFVLEAAQLDQNEMVCDFKIIKTALAPYETTFATMKTKELRDVLQVRPRPPRFLPSE